MIYALDSDIISYILKSHNNIKENFNNTLSNDDFYAIPPLVYYEVKRGLTYKKAYSKLQNFTDLYNDSVKKRDDA